MNLLYDFRAYQEFYPRGVSRYVYELFTNAILLNPGKNGILIDRCKKMPDFPAEIYRKINIYDIDSFEKGNVKGQFDVFISGSSTWLGLQEYNSIDILYPEPVLKLSRKIVSILYDFVPLIYSHYLPNVHDQINYFLQCEALRYVDHIFTISQYVSSSGMRYLGRMSEDFTCLYGGADMGRFQTKNTKKNYQGKKRNHNLVNVSGICVRKNFEGVTQAFCLAYLSQKLPQDAKLYIICSSADFFEETIRSTAEKYGLKYGKQVVATGFLSDRKMAEMIADARCSIFPSYYEGLGLPILESYMAGTPCIASNISATKEFVLEKASFNPFDLDDMARKIIQVYNDEQLCSESLAYGRKLLEHINWGKSAHVFIQKLQKL